MAVELDHRSSTSKSIDGLSLRRHHRPRARGLVRIEGGRVLSTTGPDSVKAEIVMKMGAMSLTFTGTVEVAEQDARRARALLRVKSKEAGGQGHANADVAFQLEDGGGAIHTKAQITGKAASMGEGVVIGVLDALITDFTGKLGELYDAADGDRPDARDPRGRGALRRGDRDPGPRRPTGIQWQRSG